jgi:hypothetical protein
MDHDPAKQEAGNCARSCRSASSLNPWGGVEACVPVGLGGLDGSGGFCARVGITENVMAAKRSRIQTGRDTCALMSEFAINSQLIIIQQVDQSSR